MKALECLSNRLTLLYSKIYYEEENYLEVRTGLLIYPSPPYSKGLGMWECWYVGSYILVYTHTESCPVTWLPLVLWFHWFNQSCVLRTNSQPIQVLF